MSSTIIYQRTDSSSADFAALVQQLDAYLAGVDGDEHAFYDQFNKIAPLKYVIVAYENDQPVGCGAIKPYDDVSAEVKRMYVPPTQRRKGIAAGVLSALETWAAELGYTTCILETGLRQHEAVALYQNSGYIQTANYGQYAGVANSVCFAKQLAPTNQA